MILKLLRGTPLTLYGEPPTEEIKQAWEFIDGINKCTKEIRGLIDSHTFIIYERKGEPNTCIMIDGDAYLLNDEGKTIERLF